MRGPGKFLPEFNAGNPGSIDDETRNHFPDVRSHPEHSRYGSCGAQGKIPGATLWLYGRWSRHAIHSIKGAGYIYLKSVKGAGYNFRKVYPALFLKFLEEAYHEH
jgi:hypothetical protein